MTDHNKSCMDGFGHQQGHRSHSESTLVVSNPGKIWEGAAVQNKTKSNAKCFL